MTNEQADQIIALLERLTIALEEINKDGIITYNQEKI